MSKLRKILRSEFINDMKLTDWIIFSVGIFLQVLSLTISLFFNEDFVNTIITSISGFTGCICVVLSARGKISSYFFGYIQLFTYLFAVAIPYALWGEVIENIIYALFMIVGIIIWIKRYRNKDNNLSVKSKTMDSKIWVVAFITTIFLIIGFTYLLPKLTEWMPNVFSEADPQPWLDSITTIIPLTAQVLMSLGYSDQWVFWLVEDIVSVVMFIVMGNWIMVAQYVFFSINCVYGYIKWRRDLL